MLDENLIATLEQSLRQTRNAQNRLMARLREAENESDLLRQEIGALENSAAQTEQAIDSLLVTMRSGNRTLNIDRTARVEEGEARRTTFRDRGSDQPTYQEIPTRGYRRDNSVAYMSNTRGIPSITNNIEAISNRFNDRTITQACTLLLRESGGALHVNELYNLLVAGGMKFKGNNPTISIAVSLNRNRRFRKVDPGTFDLVMREAIQAAS
ncbi:MAG: hypothetical protein ACKVQJ_06720 [Pyrinomonadaceae bacterium]